jgi:hypothetical protein
MANLLATPAFPARNSAHRPRPGTEMVTAFKFFIVARHRNKGRLNFKYHQIINRQ